MEAPRSNLSRLLAALPAILLCTFVNVFITSATAGVIMIEIAASGHPRLGLFASIVTAIVVYFWIVFNHKLRTYIKNQGEFNE